MVVSEKDMPSVALAMKSENHLHALMLNSVRPLLLTGTGLSKTDKRQIKAINN